MNEGNKVRPLSLLVLLGRVKHHWLEAIVNKSPDDVVFLWRNGEWRMLTREFPQRMEDAELLAMHFEEIWSPAQLVDVVQPLSTAPGAVRDHIKTHVHKVFLTQSA